jgi:hypothetical protein
MQGSTWSACKFAEENLSAPPASIPLTVFGQSHNLQTAAIAKRHADFNTRRRRVDKMPFVAIPTPHLWPQWPQPMN